MERCRTCLDYNGPFLSIYDKSTESSLAYLIISRFVRINPKRSDGMPDKVCRSCLCEIENCYSFKSKCEKSDRILRELKEQEKGGKILKCQKKTYAVEIEPTLVQGKQGQDCFNSKSQIEIVADISELIKQEEIPEDEFIPLIQRPLTLCKSVCASQTEITKESRTEVLVAQETENEEQAQTDEANQEKMNPSRIYTVEKPFQCSFCSKGFSTATALRVHEGIHPDTSQCSFPSNEIIKTQQVIHTDDETFTCNVCDKSFSRNSHLKNHMRSHTGEKPFQCKKCDYCSDTQSALCRHMQTHSAKMPYQSSHCKRHFKMRPDMQRHQLGDKSVKSEVVLDKCCLRLHATSNTCSRKPYKCSFCNKSFATTKILKTHQVIHTIAKTFTCNVCDRNFNRKANLESHMRIHTGEKPFQCKKCDYCSATQSTLQSHMQTHSGEKPYQCSKCKNRFARKAALRRHQLIRTESDKSVQCSICNENFLDKCSLRVHERCHSWSNKPFKCSFCDRSFTTKEILKTHQLIHTGEKAFICNVCGKSFYQKGNLQNHIRTHTGEQLSESDNSYTTQSILRSHQDTIYEQQSCEDTMQDKKVMVEGCVGDDLPRKDMVEVKTHLISCAQVQVEEVLIKLEPEEEESYIAQKGDHI